MRRAKLDDTELLEALTQVFREHGYEGASLSRIASATGLRRASLYHHFPGGKDEIALRVMRHVHGQFAGNILAPLGERGPAAARLRRVAQRLDEFYSGGRCACLLDALSLGRRSPKLQAAVAEAAESVTAALAGVAEEAGQPRAKARRLAQEALVRLEGSLVVARASGDTDPFQRTLRELPGFLLGKVA